MFFSLIFFLTFMCFIPLDYRMFDLHDFNFSEIALYL